MLSINPETVCFLIDKAHEFHAKEGVVIPEVPDSPSEDWGLQVLADHVDDLSYQEMLATIEDLEPDQLCELLVLVWLGRGDYIPVEWDEAMGVAEDFLDEQTIYNLIAIPMLADYLLEGLALLDYQCDE